jgi:hypothetical protein
MGETARLWHHQRSCRIQPMKLFPMRKPNDMSRCLAALEQDSTLIAVIDNATSYCMPFSVRLFSMLQTRHFLGFSRVGRFFCMGWPALDANPNQQSVSLMRHTQRREELAARSRPR